MSEIKQQEGKLSEAQRHKGILHLLDEASFISFSTIIEKFNVSAATARRDISKLDEQKKLHKVRSGAERLDTKSVEWSPLNLDTTDFYEEKIAIARAASTLCQNDDSVVINCGSTAFLLGQELCNKNIQIVTNYFPLASYLIQQHHENLIVLGGQYQKEQHILINSNPDSLSGYAANWMFTSGKGLTKEGLYKANMLTAVAEQQMLERIDKRVALVDSSKVGYRTGMLFCFNEMIDILITGKNADPETIAFIQNQGTEVILV